jgi:hypothetical protein
MVIPAENTLENNDIEPEDSKCYVCLNVQRSAITTRLKLESRYERRYVAGRRGGLRKLSCFNPFTEPG